MIDPGVELATEFPFELPRGYVDRDGTVHRRGVMRLATAKDEIRPLRDPRVQANEAYLTILLLQRVITSLGSLSAVDADVIEDLFTVDLAYLQDFYRRINIEGRAAADVVCPHCSGEFAVDLTGDVSGGS